MTPGGYLLVESRTGPTSRRFVGDGLALARLGHPVWLVLVGDAVATAVRGAPDGGPLAEFVAAGGRVWVDGFTLSQRGMPARVLASGAAVADPAEVAGVLLETGVRTVWH